MKIKETMNILLYHSINLHHYYVPSTSYEIHIWIS